MSDTPSWALSASSLAKEIRDGVLSAKSAARSAVERMRAVNGHYNAVVDDLGDAALEEAAALDRLMSERGSVGPLHGVPVTVKINVDQAGYATSNGVAAFTSTIADTDSPVVRNLRNAGAIIIGRTNTPEFSFRATTDNPHFGRTINPWKESASPGGSSGGAGVAVMTGMGALAHGNDLGGSLRYPAAATGAATIKPGLGRVPAYNASAGKERGLLAQLMSTQGILARQAGDLRLGLQALIAYDPRDPWMVPMEFRGPSSPEATRVAVTRDGLGFGLSPQTSTALDNACEALRRSGYEVVEVEPPLLRECGDTGFRALMSESAKLLQPDIQRFGSSQLNQIFENHLQAFPPFSEGELLRVMAQRSWFVREWLMFLEQYPLLLTPFMLGPVHDWNRDAEGVEGAEDVLGRGQYSYAMNFLGLPAGIVSAHFDGGMPVGVQIVGRRFREDMIIDALEAVEAYAGTVFERLWNGIDSLQTPE
ncbi:amidase [Rhizobium sp. AN80A]|uniref:amidase n=1 Tax=Rhizobium sp. AN80A TaxID=3040673 RepID=UPI0024B3B5AB|nr:amidase [Rhizobium sp. AN80A]